MLEIIKILKDSSIIPSFIATGIMTLILSFFLYHYARKIQIAQDLFHGEFKHEVRQFEKSYDNQQAEQISLMV